MQDLTPLLSTDEAALGLSDSATAISALQQDGQSLLDYAGTLTDTGDELMFTMDVPYVPYVPMQDTPVVLAQAVSTGTGEALQPDYVLNVCKQTESTGDALSAMRSVDPAGLLKIFIQNQVHHYVDIAAIKNVSLLEGTAHGEITSGTTNTGRTAFGYDPVPSYVGTDKAVFMAEYEGRRYKIVVQLNVFLMVDEKVPSTCPSPKLIKVNGMPVSDSSPYKLNSFTLELMKRSHACMHERVRSCIMTRQS